MRSSSPAGAPFSYSFSLAPGKYTVTLLLLEPRFDQTAGLRVLNVAINGAAVVTGLDLFAEVGALKPYSVSFPVTITAGLKLDFSATLGNALVSGIQVDSVSTPISGLDRPVCEFVWGGGWQLSSGAYSILGCEDLDGAPFRIVRVTCRCDVPGQIVDVLARDANGEWQTLLTEPVSCTLERTEAVVLPGASYSDVLLVVLRVVDPTEAQPVSPSSVLVDIVRTR
jgi:hypothetical protein